MTIKGLPPLPIDDMQKREVRLNEQASVDLKKFILREYRHRRMSPQYAGELLVTPQLIELNGTRPRRTWIPDVSDENS